MPINLKRMNGEPRIDKVTCTFISFNLNSPNISNVQAFLLINSNFEAMNQLLRLIQISILKLTDISMGMWKYSCSLSKFKVWIKMLPLFVEWHRFEYKIINKINRHKTKSEQESKSKNLKKRAENIHIHTDKHKDTRTLTLRPIDFRLR